MAESDDVWSFPEKIWRILDEMQDDPPLQLLQSLNITIANFAQLVKALPQKQIKGFINAGANAEGIAELILHCLLVDYESTSSETSLLFAALNFKNSPVSTALLQNGGQSLLARHIIIYKQNNYIPVLSQLSNSILSEGLLRAFFAEFSVKKCYLIPEFIENNVNKIFVTEFVQSLKPENIVDTISIVHALSFIIQHNVYRSELFLGEFMLELVSDHKQDNFFDFEKEEAKTNKIDIEKQKIEIEALEKRLKIIKISLEENEISNKQIMGEKEKLEEELVHYKELLNQTKNDMINLQEKVNDKNLSQAQLEAFEANYKGIENIFINQEKTVAETELKIEESTAKIVQKEQDTKKLVEMRAAINDQINTIKIVIDTELGKLSQVQKVVQKVDKEKDDNTFDLLNYETIKFSSVLFSELVKFPEGFKFFCNKKELGYLFALRLSYMDYSPQLIGCLEFIENTLLFEEPIRELIKNLLDGKPVDLTVVPNSDYNTTNIVLSNLLDEILNCDSLQSLTYIYMYIDTLEQNFLSTVVKTSFVGAKENFNYGIPYLYNAIHRLFEIGFLEACILQLLNNQEDRIKNCFKVILSHLILIIKALDIETFNYFLAEFSTELEKYENKYSFNEQLIANCQQTIIYNGTQCNTIIEEIKPYENYVINMQRKCYFEDQNAEKLPYFSRELDWSFVGIEAYPNEPIKWNWEEINFFSINQMTNEFIIENHSHLKQILAFISCSLQEGNEVREESEHEFVLNSPIQGWKFTNEKFEMMLEDSQEFYNFISLPICSQTTRIQQIALKFLGELMTHERGIQLVTESGLIRMINSQLEQVGGECSLQEARTIICLIGIMSESEEGVQLLENSKILDCLYKLVYDNSIEEQIISQLIISISPSCQTFINQKASNMCSCGAICLRNSVNNDLKLTFLSFLRSEDVRIRYEGVIKLGGLLRKRQYYLQVTKNTCHCLCYNCSEISSQQMLLNEEDSNWAMQCLMPLMNDVQPEVAIAALCIVEEFIEEKDIQMFIDNEINLKNWKNLGLFLQMKLCKNAQGRKYIGRDQIMGMMDFKTIYRIQHNSEYKQFLTLNRCIDSNLRYPSYDKIVTNYSDSADCQFLQYDQYAFDNMVLPHNTPYGRAALQLPESTRAIPDIVRKSFWTETSTSTLKTSYLQTQCYSRGNIFSVLNNDEDGIRYIVESGVVEQIVENLLLQPSKPDSVLFRGYIVSFAEIATTPLGFGLFSRGNDLIDKVVDLSINCRNERCRYAACQALQIMAYNPAVYAYVGRRVGLHRYCFRGEEDVMLSFRYNDYVKVYSPYTEQTLPIFSYGQKPIDFVSSVQYRGGQSEFYTQPLPLFRNKHEESGLAIQGSLQADFQMLKKYNIDFFMRPNQYQNITDQFKDAIQELREQHQRAGTQHLPPEAEEAIKLCFVDNVADCQAGLTQLRANYQKNYLIDFYILTLISQRHVEISVLNELYSIIGQIGISSVNVLSDFEEEFK